MKSSIASTGMSSLKNKILFVLGAIIVYRLGTHIPVPSIDPIALAAMFEQQKGTILDMFNMFSGGALERLSIFALGIMPYISAAIIMQLLTVVSPKLEQLKKEGESGRRKITQYTRQGTVVLATFQALGVAIALESQNINGMPVVIDPGFIFKLTAVVTLVSGTIFLMWLGEQITERGIGNGISLIIFAGIVAGLPSALGGTFEQVNTGALHALTVFVLLALIAAVIAFVVFVERGQRRIPVHYAQKMRGRKLYGGQESHLPLKLNMAGVIPPIFASSIILFPATLGGWFGTAEGMGWMKDIATTLSPGQPLYILFYATAIIFFCFFYTAIVFNPNETAENLRKSGAYLPGIRPGAQTARHIDGIMGRLTLAGAIYITAVCLLPEFLILYWNVPFYFGGTSLLIIVIVVMDFMTSVQAQMQSSQYDGMMKKAKLKGK
ncbi:protein translocase subunit SecY [Thiosulfatimonas sediminis]|uniref:Protein translocase subunit SecY n=1 Tax=Thiosulfatimonas sediminis TaxID=2675054 RepID=A0A6F8PXH7_9GAMM|nr:preprotein translocase subunit SecY [Thiosulfatimonas sediminis]BBP46835.1 protein translocase subunit SecY [Thiosulfatimonas sediminis]